jgi:hypothetical protein
MCLSLGLGLPQSFQNFTLKKKERERERGKKEEKEKRKKEKRKRKFGSSCCKLKFFRLMGWKKHQYFRAKSQELTNHHQLSFLVISKTCSLKSYLI